MSKSTARRVSQGAHVVKVYSDNTLIAYVSVSFHTASSYGTAQPYGHMLIHRAAANVWIYVMYVGTMRNHTAPRGLFRTVAAKQSTLFKTWWISVDCNLCNCSVPHAA